MFARCCSGEATLKGGAFAATASTHALLMSGGSRPCIHKAATMPCAPCIPSHPALLPPSLHPPAAGEVQAVRIKKWWKAHYEQIGRLLSEQQAAEAAAEGAAAQGGESRRAAAAAAKRRLASSAAGS